MPIEVRELHVKVLIEESESKEDPQGFWGLFGSSEKEGVDRQALVAECVEKVLQILKDKEEL